MKSKNAMSWLLIDKGKMLKATGFFLCLCALVFTSSSYADVKYTIIDLGTLSGGRESYALDINRWGQVVGASWTIPQGPNHTHAFLWENGVMLDLGTLGGSNSGACAINDFGQVVGCAEPPYRGPEYARGLEHAFLWQNGQMTPLLPPGGGLSSWAMDISNSGEVVGFWDDDGYYPDSGSTIFNSWNQHACLWNSEGVIINIGSLDGQYSEAYGINDFSQVVGNSDASGWNSPRAFLWDSGLMQDLGGFYSRAVKVNNAGQIVGNAKFAGWHAHAVLWEHGVMTDLGIPTDVSFTSSRALGINNFGQIVGYSYHNGGAYSRAFLWEQGEMFNLNELVSSASGWVLTEAHAINDAGQIVGYGINPAGEIHGFLLTPVSWPPPQLYAVICGNDEGGQRFGKDAEAIYNVLLDYPGIKAHNLRLVSNPSELESAITELVEKLQFGDQFLFYYSGHGFYGYDGTEPTIWNSPLVALLTEDSINEGDEYLAFGSSDISDDLLSSWLSSYLKLRGVQKIVILDSCMSGGFWGREGNERDEGDLDKLQNVGLIAACDETHFSYSYPDWSWIGQRRGRGIFSFVLEEQLRRGDNGIAPADLNQDGKVSFEELSTAMKHAYTVEEGDIGVIRGFPWLEEDIVVEIDQNEIPELYVNHQIDFDPNVPIFSKKLIADLDSDWGVDFTDLGFVISEWLEVDCNSPTWCWGADLNRSGAVNFIDFAILAEHWLEGITP